MTSTVKATQETERFVNVALDVPLPQTFSYEIPAALQGQVLVGQLLHVPWRKQSRVGVAMSLSTEPPPGVKQIKPIEEIVDRVPVIDESMAKLLTFIANYYRAPIGDVVGLAVPAGLRRAGQRVFCLTDAGRREALAKKTAKTPIDKALVLLLGEPDAALGSADLMKRIKGLTQTALDQALSQELLSLQHELEEPSVGAQTVEWLRLKSLPSAKVRLGAVQQQLVELLSDCEELDWPSVRERILGARASLKALVKRGLVEVEVREVLRDPFAGEPMPQTTRHDLTDEQAAAVQEILAGPESGTPGGYRGFLLHGVTGSGKTEVYVQVIRRIRAQNQTALVLLPEIALTPQFCGVFRSHFGDDVAVLHSGLTPGERFDAWRRVRSGEVGIVIGARSALFAPTPRLGVVVVDEEHDPSFKQGESPRYNARDMALVRATFAQCRVILGSATPSLEAFYLAHTGRIKQLKMARRVGGRALPEVQLIDMTDASMLLPEPPTGVGKVRKDDLRLLERKVLSKPLLEAIRETLRRGEQVIVLLNRRGYSPFVQCLSCGLAMQCPNCSVSLNYHQDTRLMHCHYCDFARPLPTQCPKCEKHTVGLLGIGTERLTELLSSHFPEHRIERLDRDAGSGPKQRALLREFRQGDIHILVGTQMVAKGHDIHNVTLVGVVMADMTLNFPDFRSAERTFQLLTQVAGRAGRGVRAGHVIIQTLSPKHYALQAAKFHSYEAFLAEEITMRQELGYPPFSFLVTVRFEALEVALVQDCAKDFVAAARACLGDDPKGVTILGPAIAPVGKIRGRTRYQVLLKGQTRPALRTLCEQTLCVMAPELDRDYAPVRVVVDVDPLSLL